MLNSIQARSRYSVITDTELQQRIKEVLQDFPNTGYLRMHGFLRAKGITVQEARLRKAMKIVDPVGVEIRALQNRAIVRREYFVPYSNDMWHIDTNLKLIR